MIPGEVRKALGEILDYAEDACGLPGDDGFDDLRAAVRIAGQWLDNLPQPPEPDWSKAPEWAEWWAVDANEKAHWYENEPSVMDWGWANPEGRCKGWEYAPISLGIDWRELKMRRPMK